MPYKLVNTVAKPLKMSDSDSDILPTKNLITFRNESTIVSAKGYNINATNLTGLSNVLTSTMNMPMNNGWQRRAESNCDQRSIGYRRETSPMSIASACDARQRSYNRWNDNRGMSSQRSMYNRRGGSPMSMRSIDSNASDIVKAIKNKQFSKSDIQIIKEACRQFNKHKTRKRIEKRRNMKQFMRGYLRRSGNDSGELGSDSSISSDDNRSTRGSNYKNKSSYRLSKTDVSDLKRNIKNNNLLKDCTDNFKSFSMHPIVGASGNHNTSSVSSFRSMTKKPTLTNSKPPRENCSKTNQSSTTLSDRFKNGFLLPSQRLNMPIAVSSISEEVAETHSESNKRQNAKTSNFKHNVQYKNSQAVTSADEEIFSEFTPTERPAGNLRKRSIDKDDHIYLPNNKRPKVASPCKNMSKSVKNSAIEKASNDYEFVKPAFPAVRCANLKAKEKIISKSANMNSTDMLISKSRVLLSDASIQNPSVPPKKVNPTTQLEKVEEIEHIDITEPSLISHNTTDLSMRPSFIKRKLFTQNMDVTEKTNEILADNSPQKSIYGAIQKEKNKARKLITSQCCLSRDIQPDGNNLLDLIHKIVPADRMNATNQTNKNVQSKLEDKDDKWDVSSIITTRNNDENVSDTFTDDDILDADNGILQPSPKATGKKSKKSPPKKIVEMLPPKVTKVTQKVLLEKTGTLNKTVQKSVKSFWDTDFESDAEVMPAIRRDEFKENHTTGNIGQSAASKVKSQGFSSMVPANKTSGNNTSIKNNTVDSVHRFNNTNSTFMLYTHRNTKPMKIAPEKYKEIVKSHIDPQNKIQKTTKASSVLDLSAQKKNTGAKEKSKLGHQKSPAKQGKPSKELIKETPKLSEKEKIKKQKSKDKILRSDEKNKPQNIMTTDTVQSKEQDKKESNAVQNKPKNNKKSGNNQDKAQDKKGAKDNHSKTQKNKGNETDNKPQNNIKSDSASIETQHNIKSDSHKNTRAKKADTAQLETANNNKKNNQNARSKNINGSIISDSTIYEDSRTEPDNKSLRQVQSCRISKQNATLDTSKANQTLSMSLRSREVTLSKLNNKEKNKQAPKNTRNKDLKHSYLELGKQPKCKPLSCNYNSRHCITKEIDTSDVSFSLTNDKDSPKRNRANSATSRNNNKKNNRNARSKNTNRSKISDSNNYEDSITEPDNKSLRQVQSCRISKQNATLDTSKANQTLSMSLRSREVTLSKLNNKEKNKQAPKNTRNKDLKHSYLELGKQPKCKPLSRNYNSRHCITKEIDTSDVSFSLTNDKDSPKRNRENSATSRYNSKAMNHAVIKLTPIALKHLHIKDAPRRNRLPNKRYVS